MQKFGKCSMAIVVALIMSLTLFTSGVFAQSAVHSTANQKAQAVVGTVAVVPSTTIGWGGGCFGGFGCGGGRFIHIVHFEHIVSITRFTRITIHHFPWWGGFGGGFGGFGGGFGGFGGGFGGCGGGFDGC